MDDLPDWFDPAKFSLEYISRVDEIRRPASKDGPDLDTAIKSAVTLPHYTYFFMYNGVEVYVRKGKK